MITMAYEINTYIDDVSSDTAALKKKNIFSANKTIYLISPYTECH